MTIQRSHEDGLGGFLKLTYDTVKYSGAVGTLLLPVTLPIGTIITGGFVDVDTALTSGGLATVALGLNTNVDLLAATAIASFTGILPIIPVGTAATMVKLTADRQLRMTIATAALTGGKFDLYLDYRES